MMRKAVEKFTNEMEVILKENDYKGKKGWKQNKDDRYLEKKLLEEVAEFFKSLNHPFWYDLGLIQEFISAIGRVDYHDDDSIKPTKKHQKKELVDIANICMMLHDNI